MERLFDDIQRAYETQIVAEGKEAQAVILFVYIVTFLTVRFITHCRDPFRHRGGTDAG